MKCVFFHHFKIDQHRSIFFTRASVQLISIGQWDGNEDFMEGAGAREIFISVEEYVTKINGIHDTVTALEESLTISRSLEAERWLRYSTLKAKNKIVTDDLRKANKRNKNMLST